MEIWHMESGENVQPRTSNETCGKWNRLNFQKYAIINKLKSQRKMQNWPTVFFDSSGLIFCKHSRHLESKS